MSNHPNKDIDYNAFIDSSDDEEDLAQSWSAMQTARSTASDSAPTLWQLTPDLGQTLVLTGPTNMSNLPPNNPVSQAATTPTAATNRPNAARPNTPGPSTNRPTAPVRNTTTNMTALAPPPRSLLFQPRSGSLE